MKKHLPKLDIYLNTQVDNLDLEILAQPIVCLDKDCSSCIKNSSNNSCKRIDFEILSRFYHNNQKIMPDEIFDNPKNKKVSETLDKLIFEESLKQVDSLLPTWDCDENYSIGLNVSKPSVENYKNFLPFVDKLFSKYPQLKRENFYLELNEKCNGGVPDFVKKAFNLGFAISIDDMGVDNLSMNLVRYELIPLMDSDLSRLKLKIDKSFILNLYTPQNKQKKIDLATVNQVVSVSETYPQIKVIAEGIENKLTADNLKKLGVHYGQGYYWAKPSNLNTEYKQPTFFNSKN